MAKERRWVADTRAQAVGHWRKAFDAGAWNEVRVAAEALYALDSNDPVHVARLIEATGRLGDVASAERTYEEYRASLAPGANPNAEVTRSIEGVRSLRQAVTAPVFDDESRPTFVGRAEALAAARDLLGSTGDGRCETLLITGESGIGKTRLLDEIQQEAVLSGFRCLRAQLVELERGIPLTPLVDALCQTDLEPHLKAVGEPWASVVAKLLPPGTLNTSPRSPPPIQESSLSRRLLDSFFLIFGRLAASQPTVLLLDDLHWADATTLSSLQFLQRRWGEAGPFAIFATYRPDLIGRSAPITTYLRSSAGSGALQIELRPLLRDEGLALVRAIAGREISESFASRLCDITGHHPLYLTELTREYMAGRLTLDERHPAELAIPRSLEHMLDVRLEGMDHCAMKVAGILAVAARDLRVKEISQLTGLQSDDTAYAIETLERARFVVSRSDRLRVAHELFRTAIYRHLSLPRRAMHHRAVADHLLSSESEQDVAGELCFHFAQAGEDGLAARYGWIAARRALDAGAVAEAVRSLEVVRDSEQDPVRRADASAELACALHLARDITRANPQLRDAAQCLRVTGQPGRARHLEIKRIGGLAEVDAAPISELLRQLASIKAEARGVGDWESVALALDAQLELLHRSGDVEAIPPVLGEMREISETSTIEAKLLSRAGLALGVFFGDPDEALVAAQEAVELADSGQTYRLRALNRLLVALHARGMLTLPEAARHVDEARVLAEHSGDRLAHFCVESNIAVAYLDAGDVDRAQLLLARADQVAGEGEMHINRFIQANNEGELALAQRDYHSAAGSFSRAASFLGMTTPKYMQDLVNAGLGYCALERGEFSEARQRQALLHTPPRSWYFDPTTILAFRARLLERQGHTGEAIDLLAEGAADLKDRLTLAWMKVELLRVRLLAKSAPLEARELAGQMAQQARSLTLPHRAKQFQGLITRLSH